SLIIGGTASGKSHFGETLARHSGQPRIYIATAQAFDDEMRAKIAKHRADRGPDWITIEAPLDMPKHVINAPKGQTVFVDCLTLWLSNHLLAENPVDHLVNEFLDACENTDANVIVITNEVGQSVVPENALARRFQNAQGQINQSIAARADLVVHVLAGIPMAISGNMPAGLP
ncbi:UNVERIFIED_CONTAM: hypothetical protein GTU68_034004, partial [Idotea baltica]|nr:hypothetical protein [Idotea baltica]